MLIETRRISENLRNIVRTFKLRFKIISTQIKTHNNYVVLVDNSSQDVKLKRQRMSERNKARTLNCDLKRGLSREEFHREGSLSLVKL